MMVVVVKVSIFWRIVIACCIMVTCLYWVKIMRTTHLTPHHFFHNRSNNNYDVNSGKEVRFFEMCITMAQRHYPVLLTTWQRWHTIWKKNEWEKVTCHKWSECCCCRCRCSFLCIGRFTLLGRFFTHTIDWFYCAEQTKVLHDKLSIDFTKSTYTVNWNCMCVCVSVCLMEPKRK